MAVLDSIREVLIGNGNGDRIPKGVQEQLNTASIMNEILQENIQRLEMQLEDEGWRPISGELEQEFTRHGLDRRLRCSPKSIRWWTATCSSDSLPTS
jgi:hypothetical protein